MRAFAWHVQRLLPVPVEMMSIRMQPDSCALGTEQVEAVRSGFAVLSTGEASQGGLDRRATPPPHASCARYASTRH